MSKRSNIRRYFTLAVFCLCAGFIVNLVIAWRACFGWDQSYKVEYLTDEEAAQMWTSRVGPSKDNYEIYGYTARRLALDITMLSHLERSTNDRNWKGGEESYRFLRAGWPFRAFHGERYYRGSVTHRGRGKWQEDFKGAFRVPWFRYPLNPFAYFPYYPIWPGLLANTLLYALVSYGIFTLIGHTRRRIRLGKSLCPRCAYDLRRLVEESAHPCPECGTLVDPRQLQMRRSLLRAWMLPLLIPQLFYGVAWMFGYLHWNWVRFKLRWHEPALTPSGWVCLAFECTFIAVLAWQSYSDRPAMKRALISMSVAIVLGCSMYLATFALYVRFFHPFP